MGAPIAADDRAALTKADAETIRTELETLGRRLSHLSGQLDRLAAHQDHQLQLVDHRLELLDRRLTAVTDQVRQLEDQARQHSAQLSELLVMRRDINGPLELVRLLSDAQRRLHFPFTLTGFCARVRSFEQRLKGTKARPQQTNQTGGVPAAAGEGATTAAAGGSDSPSTGAGEESLSSPSALSPPDLTPSPLSLRGRGEELPVPAAEAGQRELGSDEPEIRIHCNHPPLDVVARVGSVLRLDGWTVARAGVRAVAAFVDGEPTGSIVYGQPRPDVGSSFPELPSSANCGFRGYVDLRALPAGRHRLRIRVADTAGAVTDLQGEFELDHGYTETSIPIPDLDEQYQQWLQHHALTADRLRGLAGAASRLEYRPAFSILMPVYNTPVELLRLAIESVLAQVYPEWELCIVDDGSTDPRVRPVLEDFRRRDPRIRVAFLEENCGIGAATDAALEVARGEFIGLLDHDDELWPNALYECARLLNERPETDLIYSDEDKIDADGRHCLPFFKPDWSPDLLTSMMYTCHFSVYRRASVLAVGGFRAEFSGSQDYDLALRVTEQTGRIEHIPTILYSWRIVPGSAAAGDEAKPQAVAAARRALEAAVARRGLDAVVEPTFTAGRWRVRYRIPDPPPVTLVVPTGGKHSLLAAGLESLLGRTDYPSFELLLVDNSEGDEVRDLATAIRRDDSRLRYLELRDRPFNFSALVNRAVEHVQTPYLALVNDDVTVADAGWLGAMMEHAQRPEVGLVGAKLLYPDGSIQHAGVVVGICEIAGHAFRYYPPDHHGYVDLIDVVRNVGGVTFAAALMRRAVYEEVGGLDAEYLRVAFNDVDFCLRVRRRGYRIVYTPHAVLYHHELASRSVFSAEGETTFMKEVWADALRGDPFYNPNLSRNREDYSLAVAEGR